MTRPKSVITRVYVPTYVRDLPNGERVTVPGHYRQPHSSDSSDSRDDEGHQD